MITVTSCIECDKTYERSANTPLRKFCSRRCQSRNWRRNNLALVKQVAIAYYHRDRAKNGPPPRTPEKAAYDRKWQQENKDKVSERNRRWKKRNPDKVIAQSHRRRGLKIGSYTAEEWNAIPFNDICSYCGSRGKMTVDHVVPISAFGPNTIDNLVPACQSCNAKKHDDSLIYFLAQRSA